MRVPETFQDEHTGAASAAREAVVFDIGGTHFRCARWSPESGVRRMWSKPSPSVLVHPDAGADELRTRLIDEICAGVGQEKGTTAGISLGAALDQRSGVVYASAPLWGDSVTRFDLLAGLRERRPDVDWHLVNDVTAALLGLGETPRFDGFRRLLLVTVSSGIACRLVDRRLRTIPVDVCGLQGEIGHIPSGTTLAGNRVELNCDCGSPDHLAAFASGPGIRRLAERLRELEPRRCAVSPLFDEDIEFESTFRRLLDDDDPLAREILDAATSPLADVLRTAWCLDPSIDRIALTGGVVDGLGEHYHRALAERLTRDGVYLTSRFHPEWLAERLVRCDSSEADGLVGAGVAAVGSGRSARIGVES
ncbi:glucokinase [Actinopolyspora lacussalsi]|uniref:Glucokinase n=1 Tax=Actinopolyspora righensis TaxID=995060 RepID=A0A1I6YGB7_9ACTN|nr:ROK family protein [Actinopolyspora righensis]MDP9644183.1 glucokinase [Actinopolyspora lacussalsi]SFT49357.1 glucokinase [Actinopolyspora righensis]